MELANRLTAVETAAPNFRRSIVEKHREDGYWIETFKLHPHDKVPGLIAYVSSRGTEQAYQPFNNSYGLDQGEVKFFDNPANHGTQGDVYLEDAEWDILPRISQRDLQNDYDYDSSYKQSLGDSDLEDSLHLAAGWSSTLIAKLDSPVAVFVVDVDGDGRDDLIICYNYGKDFIDCNPDGGYIAWLKNAGRNKQGQPVKKTWVKRYIGRWPAMHRLKAGFFTQRCDRNTPLQLPT